MPRAARAPDFFPGRGVLEAGQSDTLDAVGINNVKIPE